MYEVLVNRLGGLSLPRKSVVRLTDRPDMTLDVYRGRKTTKQNKKKSLHRGDSNEYTHHIIITIKKKLTLVLNIIMSAAVGIFS